MLKAAAPCRLSVIALGCVATPALAQQTVEYRMTLDAEWSADTHPTNFPSNPHFSEIIGATHTAAVSLWEPGGIATDGIERMAELGATGTLESEVQSHIALGGADQFLNLRGIQLSPGVRNGMFTADAGFPLVTLVTMIAPSPDWFVGIHGVDLRPGGVWARELVFDLYAYDAGTDSGPSYQSPNADVTPHEPIANITGVHPFTGHGRLGTLRLELQSDAACSVADLAQPYNELSFADVSAFLAAFAASDGAADLAEPFGELTFADISAFLGAFAAGCP